MESKSKQPPPVSKPKDKSLEAYKTWIDELLKQFTTAESDYTLTESESEWIANWKEYWQVHAQR